jgi:hypothetical protein
MHIPGRLPSRVAVAALIAIAALAFMGTGCSKSTAPTTAPPGGGTTPPGTPDTVPPTVSSFYPTNNATNVPTNVRPVVIFSEPLQSASVNAATFSIAGVVSAVSLSGAMAWLTPTNPAPLAPNTTYSVTIRGGTNGVKDLVGNALASDKTWSFTTGSTSASTPCDGFYQPAFQLVSGIDLTLKPGVSVPAKGIPFADPTYGTCVVRVSDAHAEIPPYLYFARVDYSRRQAFNADDSLILVYAYDGTWHVYDARTLQYVKKVPGPGGDAEPQWDPTDPNTLYYLPNNGGLTISKVNVQTGVSSVVANFAGRLPWASAARVWTESEGSPSADGCYWGFLVQDSSFNFLGLMTYNLCTDTILGTTNGLAGFSSAYAPNNVTMSPSGKYIVAQYAINDRPLGANLPGGPISFTADFQSYRHLRPNGQTAHTDVAIGANGHDSFVGDDEGDAPDSGNLYMVDLDTGQTTNLFSFWTNPSSYFAGHISGKAFQRPGWVVVSEFGGEFYGQNDWFNNKVYLVELVPNPRIFYLAHHHTVFAQNGSGDDDYFSQVHASPNRDLTKFVFNSNWDRPGLTNVDTYLIEIPPGAVP